MSEDLGTYLKPLGTHDDNPFEPPSRIMTNPKPKEKKMKLNEQQIAAIKSVWNDALGCHWCNRNTDNPLKGHDGFCPIPLVFQFEAELEQYKADLSATDEQVHYLEDHIQQLKDENQVMKEASLEFIKAITDVLVLTEKKNQIPPLPDPPKPSNELIG